MRLLTSIAPCLAFALAGASAWAKTDTDLCPPRIDVAQTLEQPPSGWSVLSEPASFELTNIAFYEGHPEQLAELAPSRSSVRRKRLDNEWSFSSSAKSIWLKCLYRDTTLTLIKPLPSPTAACKVTYDARFAPPRWREAACR